MRPKPNQRSFGVMVLLFVIVILALAAIGALVAIEVVGHDLHIAVPVGEVARHILVALLLGGGGLAISALFHS